MYFPLAQSYNCFILHNLHNLLMILLVFILTYVLYYLILFINIKPLLSSNSHYTLLNYVGRNYFTSTNTHNSNLECIWTCIPILILLCVAFPSIKILYYLENMKNFILTYHIIGHQWYWSYESWDMKSSDEIFSINSYMIKSFDLLPNNIRLLSTDNPLYIPINTNLRLLTSSTDVIHSWTIPTMGVKADCIPGRLNQIELNFPFLGVYFGQCSEICGQGHSYMPINVITTLPPLLCENLNN